MNERDEKAGEMRAEYDFSRRERGKHDRAYRDGHSVRIAKADGAVEECHFTLEEGAVMLDSDTRAGQYSIRINDQYRVCFRWTAIGPEDVEIVDYH